MDGKWTIYCHTHKATGRRYIGLTKKTMRRRWIAHVRDARCKRGQMRGHFANAINKYGIRAFSHEILETCNSLSVANLAEECWVEFYETRNPKFGFNLMRGGGHTPHPVTNPWDRPEYRAKAPNNISYCLTPEARANQQAAIKTPESRSKRSAWAKISMNSPETIAKRRMFQDDPSYKAKISETTKAGLAVPEIREKISAGIRAMWQKPEVREKIIASVREANSRPEVRAKLSAMSKATWDDPEIRARRLAAFRKDAARPEKKEKLSRAALGRRHTPESIEYQRQLGLQRSSVCKFCDGSMTGKRSCINGRVACLSCYELHKSRLASFRRPDGAFLSYS